MLKEFQGGNSQSTKKRVKKRSVLDALHRVREWRSIYEQGKSQQNTKQPRFSLQEAANLVKIPKKTTILIGRIEDFSNKRMGFLRSLIQKNKAYIKTAALIRKQIKKECMHVERKDPYQSKIKMEFENLTSVQKIKEEYVKTDANQEVNKEIKEEELEDYSQNQLLTENKF